MVDPGSPPDGNGYRSGTAEVRTGVRAHTVVRILTAWYGVVKLTRGNQPR